jgi:hypothetical protein
MSNPKPRKWRKLVYFKQVSLAAYATFDIAQPRTIEEPETAFFDLILAEVRKSGFSYTLFELTETVSESNCGGDLK